VKTRVSKVGFEFHDLYRYTTWLQNSVLVRANYMVEQLYKLKPVDP
jgi:hypothetical protein